MPLMDGVRSWVRRGYLAELAARALAAGVLDFQAGVVDRAVLRKLRTALIGAIDFGVTQFAVKVQSRRLKSPRWFMGPRFRKIFVMA